MRLAIDPSLRNTGWSVFEGDNLVNCGVIKTKTGSAKTVTDALLADLSFITSGISSLVEQYKIQQAVMEFPYGGQTAKTIQSMFSSASCIFGTLSALKITPYTILPRTAKKCILSDSTAGKEEIMAWVTGHYPNFKFPKHKNSLEHIADSIIIYRTALALDIFDTI